MLKLTIKPGEYINIGEDIRIVFSGGSANNMHILVDAPREMNICLLYTSPSPRDTR